MGTGDLGFSGAATGKQSSPSPRLTRANLIVKECVPDGSILTRVTPCRTAHIRTANEALSLPWIARLPGEKWIRFIHGQRFVIQNYAGSKLIRAHICRSEEPWTAPAGVQ